MVALARTPGPLTMALQSGAMACFADTKKPDNAGLWMKLKPSSGSVDAVAAVHHFGFKFGFEGLHLAEDSQTTGRAAHLALQLVEDLVQPLSGGPEGRVVLLGCGIHVHGGSVCFLDFMIVIAGDLG